jgi:hypothetical protein
MNGFSLLLLLIAALLCCKMSLASLPPKTFEVVPGLSFTCTPAGQSVNVGLVGDTTTLWAASLSAVAPRAVARAPRVYNTGRVSGDVAVHDLEVTLFQVGSVTLAFVNHYVLDLALHSQLLTL